MAPTILATTSKAASPVVAPDISGACRPGASQPRLLPPQPPGYPPPPHPSEKRQLHFRVASFNLGISQAMIKEDPQVMEEHVQSVCGRIVTGWNTDLFFGCKVGGARGGFKKTERKVHDILRKSFNGNLDGPFADKYSVHECDNFIAVFGFERDVSVCLHGTPKKCKFEADGDADAVIACFDLQPRGVSEPEVHLVVGNLHIDCGSIPGKKQRIVQELRDKLEKYSAPSRDISVVRLIVGDDNLSTEEVQMALQQRKDADPLWTVTTSSYELPGDHMAVSGAIGIRCPIKIGKSFSKERFMCLEEHDVVAVDFFLSADPLFATDQSAEDGTDADDLSSRADWDNSTQEETRESSPESEGESGDKDTRQSTAAAHEEMQEFWTLHYGTDCDQSVLEVLNRLLFMKRKRGAVTDASRHGLAFASQEETWRAIKRVLDRRQKYLERIGINEVNHHMNEEQKAEFCKLEREVFHTSGEQKKRQASDRKTYKNGLPQKAGEKKTE